MVLPLKKTRVRAASGPGLLVALVALGALGAVAHAQEAPERQDPQEPGAEPPQRPRGGADPSEDAFRLGSPPALAEGLTEEEMWPAATDEGWRKPCLVSWQRSFDDALRVAREERRPILVAVNMDGEIASEHFAGVRYREPATAALMAPYVCIIASVYRHTPRDYDEEGRRVECPRFGTVTCAEHIENERALYELYFDGTRVAPRHIVLDLEGKETYDVYYSWDTATVFTTFEKGIEGWPEPGEPTANTIPDLVRRADVQNRERLEGIRIERLREIREDPESLAPGERLDFELLIRACEQFLDDCPPQRFPRILEYGRLKDELVRVTRLLQGLPPAIANIRSSIAGTRAMCSAVLLPGSDV